MKKFFLFSLLLLVMLLAVGCSFNLREMGLPFIPTFTYTPPPTVPATPTATLPPKPAQQTDTLKTEILENETTRFTDSALAYQADFSSEWLVVVSELPFETQLADVFGTEVPAEFRILLSAHAEEPTNRMVALDYTYRYSFRPPTSITFYFSPNPLAFITEIEAVLEDNIQAVPTLMPGAAVTYQTVQTNANGLEYGKMIIDQTDENYNLQVRSVVALFKISEGVLVVTGSTPEDQYTKLEPVLQKVIDSIQPLQ